MTCDEIMAMEAGRAMDGLIANEVFGLRIADTEQATADGCTGKDPWYWAGAGIGGFCRVSVPPYSTDIAAAMEMESHIDTLANYMGEIVQYEVRKGNFTSQRGCPIRERYVTTLTRVVCPHIQECEQTTMGSNNWIRRHFRSDELWALIHATPAERCKAALIVTAREAVPA